MAMGPSQALLTETLRDLDFQYYQRHRTLKSTVPTKSVPTILPLNSKDFLIVKEKSECFHIKKYSKD
jgi:hypothetical protein